MIRTLTRQRRAALLFAPALLLGLAACGSDAKDTTAAVAETTVAAPAETAAAETEAVKAETTEAMAAETTAAIAEIGRAHV